MESTIQTTTGDNRYLKFEEAYIHLRQSEKRLFSDVEILQLPYVPKQHPHFKEWRIRKQSAYKLFKYLKSLKRPLKILEVGCGNGWLSAYLTNIPNVNITGIDVNLQELDQAKKLFASKTNLRFINASIEDLKSGMAYDIILFASSIQYFSSIQNILNQSLQKLNENGEIHIIDTMFYRPGEVEEARKRSSVYFNETGHNEMAEYYYHHSLEDMSSFNKTILKRPSSIFKFLFKIKDPFYWIRLKS